MLRALGVVGSGVDSGEGMGSEHRSVAPGAEGRVLAVLDDLGGVLLQWISSGQCCGLLDSFVDIARTSL